MAACVKPRTRTKFGTCVFRFACPDAWNSLPSHLHFITDTAAFKHKLKLNFLDKCLITDSELLLLCGVALYKFRLYCIIVLYRNERQIVYVS